MSIISIEKEESQKKSIAKSIDQSAEALVYDILQKSQYVKPIDSAVRETVSNGVDALKEKFIASEILSGRAKEEDYFITRDGNQYKDSNFNRDYYNPNWFSNVDEVVITYKQGQGVGFCDSIEIQDTGVGLSPERMRNLFNLGYSTKRNTNKGALGGYGLGAKSPLATGVDYYLIETCYNGMKYIAQCYNHKTELLIGKFNEDGSENPHVVFNDKNGNEVIWYYHVTNDKNGTKVTIPSKRINRDKYSQAVKSQLLYFDKVKFIIEHESGYRSEESFKARVLYNSDNIIISDNNYYSKPHILIVKDKESTEAVCYGYIDFREMEMEELYSSVGVKCTIRSVIKDEETGEEQLIQDGVSVSPSRESIIFDDNTRNYIINKFKDVQDEASKLISDKLKETDFLLWIEKASNALANSGSDPILNRLSKVIDKSSINPVFPGTNIKYVNSPNAMFEGFYVKEVFVSNEYDKTLGKYVNRLKKEYANNGWVPSSLIYFKDEDYSKEKDMYILSLANQLGYSKFIIVDEIPDNLWIGQPKLTKDISLYSEAELKRITDSHEEKQRLKKEKIWKLYSESLAFKNYSEVTIPDDWLEAYKKKNQANYEDSVEIVKQRELTPKEKRALDQRTVCFTPYETDSYSSEEIFKWRKVEPKVGELTDFSGYYGLSDDELALKTAYMLTSVKVFRVSSANQKHFKKVKKIKNFFERIEGNNIITMAPELINWYTAFLINKKINKFSFLEGWKSINYDIYSAYIELKSFHELNYKNWYTSKEFHDTSIMQNVINFCDKILELQTFALDNNDEKRIKEKASELFTLEYQGGKAVINEYYRLLNSVEEYCESIYPLFNEVGILVRGERIHPNVERLILDLVELKELQTFQLDPTIMKSIIKLKNGTTTSSTETTESHETDVFETTEENQV